MSEVDGKKLIFEAYDLILKALEIKEDNWAAHKWASILLNKTYAGIFHDNILIYICTI